MASEYMKATQDCRYLEELKSLFRGLRGVPVLASVGWHMFWFKGGRDEPCPKVVEGLQTTQNYPHFDVHVIIP